MSGAGPGAVITAIGAVTPVGAGAAQTCASIRAGIGGFVRHPTYYPLLPAPIVEDPETISCGFASTKPPGLRREPRLLRLALAAVHDLVGSAGLSRAETAATDVCLCLGGGERPGFPPLDQERLAQELPRRLGVAFDRPVRVNADGQTAVYREVAEALRRDHLERLLILAVDSLIGDDILTWFDQRDRLRSSRTLDGFLPGEAAACFLVESARSATARGRAPLARIAGAALGREPNTIAGDANSTGQGLCQAIQAVAPALGGGPVPWAVCDMNGESYGAYEWGVATSRLGETLGETALWHPADCMGWVGAASAALSAVVATRAMAQGYGPADRVLLWCSSDGPERAACALTAVTPTREPARRR